MNQSGNNLRDQLDRITGELLATPTDQPGQLLNFEKQLYDLLVQSAGTNLDLKDNRDHIYLESGKAIGSVWAALCIQDIYRTKKFADGIYAAVVALQEKQNNGASLHILYAGTGPFAALILPLVGKFTSDEIQFSFLEINEQSLKILKKTIEVFELENYVRRIEKADAVKWKVPAGENIDIFISETMQQALQHEPIVSIYLNILPQLSPNTIVIPEEVVLYASLIDISARINKRMGIETLHDPVKIIEPIFELNSKNILENAGAWGKQGNAFQFREKVVQFPASQIETHDSLNISTFITVFNGTDIKEECSLTLPHHLLDLEKGKDYRIKFYYKPGKEPGIRFEIV